MAALVVVSAIAAIVGWQTSYGHAARETLARVSPSLRWMAPDAASNRIEEMTQSVDRMASDIAASREQITRSIDQLAAGQEEMTRELVRLRAVSQYASGQAAADGSRRAAPRHSR
jgi:methyl-accepting chemotaxis protein